MTLHGAAATRPERDGPERATMAAIRDRGVNFKNSHSMFPTFSTADAASFATGHYPGDTGDFSNTIYVGHPVKAANGSVPPYLEADPVLGDVDQHFDGNYLDEDTILLAARHQGPPSARWGRRLIFDHTERSGEETIIVDDSTGSPVGSPLSRAVKDKLAAAGLPIAAPGRGDNGKVGDLTTPGTNAANTIQQRYFADVASKVALPMLKARNKPFVLVFWSRDPDGTQHNQRDSLNELTLGINGPTSAAAVRNADDNLEQRQDALGELGLADDPISSSRLTMASRPSRSRARPARPRKRTIRMFRKASCRPDSWRSISRRISGFPSSIPTIRVYAAPRSARRRAATD
jgi:hypothetical protein